MIFSAPSSFVESVASEDIRTSGLYADYTVAVEDGDSADVDAYLKLSGGLSTTYVNLGGGDTLSASAGGTTWLYSGLTMR